MNDVEQLRELINVRFDAVDQRLDGLTEQVRTTNGRLRSAEGHIADHRPRLLAVEREIKRFYKEVDEFRKSLSESVSQLLTALPDLKNAHFKIDASTGETITKEKVKIFVLGGGAVVTAWKAIELVIHYIGKGGQ